MARANLNKSEGWVTNTTVVFVTQPSEQESQNLHQLKSLHSGETLINIKVSLNVNVARQFLIRWGFRKPLLPTQKLEFIHPELTCSRTDQAKVVFWQMQKLKLSISKIKSCMLKKSTVFNFLYIFQLIQKALTSNF